MLRPEDLPKPSTRRCAAMTGFELLLLTAIVVAVAPTVCSQTVNSVLTYRFNSHGDGENTSETTLTPSNVNASQFKKLFSDPVDGAIYAEPLYMPGVLVGTTTHNIVYVATENDSVYGFDADAAGPPLWHSSFLGNGITPVQDSQVGNCVDITPQYGITATPVIDPTTHMLYVVANTMESGVNT